MKYNRNSLEKAARAALLLSRTSHENANAKATAAEKEAAQAWHDRHAEAWLAACRSITRKLRKGGTVTAGDLPRVSDGYRCNDVALHQPARERGPWVEPPDIANAVARLAAVDLPVVSVRQLTELGIDAGTLRRITPLLEPGSVVA